MPATHTHECTHAGRAGPRRSARFRKDQRCPPIAVILPASARRRPLRARPAKRLGSTREGTVTVIGAAPPPAATSVTRDGGDAPSSRSSKGSPAWVRGLLYVSSMASLRLRDGVPSTTPSPRPAIHARDPLNAGSRSASTSRRPGLLHTKYMRVLEPLQRLRPVLLRQEIKQMSCSKRTPRRSCSCRQRVAVRRPESRHGGRQNHQRRFLAEPFTDYDFTCPLVKSRDAQVHHGLLRPLPGTPSPIARRGEGDLGDDQGHQASIIQKVADTNSGNPRVGGKIKAHYDGW